MQLFRVLLSFLLTSFCLGFTSLSKPTTRSITLFVEPDRFYRAVDCAENGRCSLEEMDTLATELEEFVGVAFEEDSDVDIQEKEIMDRQDVAEILRLQIELKLRLDYLDKANLFAADVKREHCQVERKQFKEELLANREKNPGSDLGLW